MDAHSVRRALAALGLVAVAAAGRPALASAQPYSVRRAGDVGVLEDAKSQTTVSVLPAVGNLAVSMKVKGHETLRWPYESVEAFKVKPGLSGIPFLGPWANRLDEQAFYANGRRYPFDMELGNVRGTIPIHGFLSTATWQLVEASADGKSAWIVSRLDFLRQPAWMKQFPFAHTIDMTYRLQGGVLQVQTKITNLSAEAMPVAVGFHPYFKLTDSTRDEWTISVGARTHWLLSPQKVPTGETEPIERVFPAPDAASLKDYNLDNVFSDLQRDAQGLARMTVKGKRQQLDVMLGPLWRSVVVWAPKPGPQNDPNFIAFEPMAGITNAMSLAHKGLYKELQSIAPGGTWDASFWVKPSGF